MNSNPVPPNTLHYLFAYAGWLITVILAVLNLVVWRVSATIALAATPWHHDVDRALNQFGFLLLAIFGLAVIVGTEHYYRTGVEQHKLWQRFWYVTGWEVLFLLLGHLMRLAGEIVLNVPSQTTWIIITVEAVITTVLFWLYRRTRQPAP